MKEHKWEQAWNDKKFEIKTLTPSILVSRYAEKLKPGDSVLDVGCGNGRNSIFLARGGCKVDCFDVIDLQWKVGLSSELQDKISFKKSNILDYPYKVAQYRAIVVARVIQYLSAEELSVLFRKIKEGLTPNGFLLLSYTVNGGIFSRKEIDVPTYSYPIDQVESLLREIFEVVVITKGDSKSKHTNYTEDNTTFDIYASGSQS